VITCGGVPIHAVVRGAHHAGLCGRHLDPRGNPVDPAAAVELEQPDLNARRVRDGAWVQGLGTRVQGPGFRV
jgi:hypothetical protein